MMSAWCEKYLDINLTSGEMCEISLSRDLLLEVIGGVGLAAHLLYEGLPPNADPLGADNMLVFAPGPLSGSTWPGTGRLVIGGRSPLTGLWGEASMGGYFATHIKRAGYDALVLHGSAPEPVYLLLYDGQVELRPAAHLWGMETYRTEEHLTTEHPGAETITIGPAGENQVPLASLVHHMGNNIASRCGLGAVAGAKNLKALVAKGEQPLEIADPEAFKELKREAIKRFNEHDFIQVIRRGGGTAAATPMAIEMGDLTARNWDLEIKDWGPEEAQKLTGPKMQAQFPAKQDTCYACPVACKWSVQAPEIDGQSGHLPGPEYESIAALGAQVQVSDTLAVIQSADLCNRLGIDTISTGATIAWALEAHQKGLLPGEIVDADLELGWGKPELVIELVRRMAESRPGLGALLAGGSRNASEAIGAGSNFAIQVKGLELPFHHPRALRGLELAYATLPRGASHNEEGVSWDFEDTSYEDWVAESIRGMNLSGAHSSMVYCQFLAGALDADYSARLLTAATGEDYTPRRLIRAGERAWYLRRLFNLRLGVGAEADTLPARIRKQIEESDASLKDFDKALKEFYRQRDLDENGRPSSEKLAALGLDGLIVIEEDR